MPTLTNLVDGVGVIAPVRAAAALTADGFLVTTPIPPAVGDAESLFFMGVPDITPSLACHLLYPLHGASHLGAMHLVTSE